jgi:protein tyrosine/serine phosphatase
MNYAVCRFVFTSALLFLSLSISGQPVDRDSLPNFHKVNENLYRGGEPKESGIAELKKLGIRTVINIGHGPDDAARERRWVESHGMKYVSLYLREWFKSKASDIDFIIKEVEAKENYPVFLHCERGRDRTGTIIAIYRMRNDGWGPKQAIDEARKYGMGWWQFPMKDVVNDYYRDRIVKKQ